MAVTGSILTKKDANAITRHEQRKQILSHATYFGHKREQREDRKTVFISSIMSIVSSPSKKIDQNKDHTIKDLL